MASPVTSPRSRWEAPVGNTFLQVLALAAALMLAAQTAQAAADVCQHCGMKAGLFPHSWILIEHQDGAVEGLCSVRCAALDMALHTGNPVLGITVSDYATLQQIPAQSAYWILGGDLPGVMTRRAKWAFGSREAARQFQTQHGGELATFDQVMQAAFDDLYRDTLDLNRRRLLAPDPPH